MPEPYIQQIGADGKRKLMWDAVAGKWKRAIALYRTICCCGGPSILPPPPVDGCICDCPRGGVDPVLRCLPDAMTVIIAGTTLNTACITESFITGGGVSFQLFGDPDALNGTYILPYNAATNSYRFTSNRMGIGAKFLTGPTSDYINCPWDDLPETSGYGILYRCNGAVRFTMELTLGTNGAFRILGSLSYWTLAAPTLGTRPIIVQGQNLFCPGDVTSANIYNMGGSYPSLTTVGTVEVKTCENPPATVFDFDPLFDCPPGTGAEGGWIKLQLCAGSPDPGVNLWLVDTGQADGVLQWARNESGGEYHYCLYLERATADTSATEPVAPDVVIPDTLGTLFDTCTACTDNICQFPGLCSIATLTAGIAGTLTIVYNYYDPVLDLDTCTVPDTDPSDTIALTITGSTLIACEAGVSVHWQCTFTNSGDYTLTSTVLDVWFYADGTWTVNLPDDSLGNNTAPADLQDMLAGLPGTCAGVTFSDPGTCAATQKITIDLALTMTGNN